MIKLIHMSTAFISISFFIVRGFWVFNNSLMMNKKWVKILPHINDTILLITAIMLALSLQQYPFTHDWLTAKFIALISYIIFGMFALKRAKEMKNKVVFFVLALLTFAYIIGTALNRTVSWFL